MPAIAGHPASWFSHPDQKSLRQNLLSDYLLRSSAGLGCWHARLYQLLIEASELLARSGQVLGYDGTGLSKKGMGTPAKECSCGVKGHGRPCGGMLLCGEKSLMLLQPMQS